MAHRRRRRLTSNEVRRWIGRNHDKTIGSERSERAPASGWLTEDELRELADGALSEEMGLGDYGRSHRAMILFAAHVGIRQGELFTLQRQDVVDQTCTIRRSGSGFWSRLSRLATRPTFTLHRRRARPEW
jgi:integrase